MGSPTCPASSFLSQLSTPSRRCPPLSASDDLSTLGPPLSVLLHSSTPAHFGSENSTSSAAEPQGPPFTAPRPPPPLLFEGRPPVSYPRRRALIPVRDFPLAEIEKGQEEEFLTETRKQPDDLNLRYIQCHLRFTEIPQFRGSSSSRRRVSLPRTADTAASELALCIPYFLLTTLLSTLALVPKK